LIPRNLFQALSEEMRCGICLEILRVPMELPCYHLFCLDCLRRQVTIQKSFEKFPRCAECNQEFSMRTITANRTMQSGNAKMRRVIEIYLQVKAINEVQTGA
jgi:hypothetical protein